MPSTAFCRSCDVSHARPLGRNCKWLKVGNATAKVLSVSNSSIPTVNASATPSSPVTQSDRDDLILSTLNAINAKVTALDGRVQNTERALADRTTHPVDPIASSSDSQNANASNVATPTALFVSTAVIPTTDYLKNNIDIQKQVDARFVELHNAQVLSSSTGKLKSQRGGQTDVPIKIYVPHKIYGRMHQGGIRSY